MNIKEFIEMRKKNTMQAVKNVIATKAYLPYSEKQALIDRVLNKSQVINYGYVQFDELKKFIVFTTEIIMAYTNLEFDTDFNIAITEYDALCEAGLLGPILETFDGEYNAVLNLMTMRQEYILQQNSVEFQVIKFLNGLNDKLDTLTDAISENINSFDLKSLNISTEDINKLMNVIGKLGN